MWSDNVFIYNVCMYKGFVLMSEREYERFQDAITGYIDIQKDIKNHFEKLPFAKFIHKRDIYAQDLLIDNLEIIKCWHENIHNNEPKKIVIENIGERNESQCV